MRWLGLDHRLSASWRAKRWLNHRGRREAQSFTEKGRGRFAAVSALAHGRGAWLGRQFSALAPYFRDRNSCRSSNCQVITVFVHTVLPVRNDTCQEITISVQFSSDH